jgi:Recombination endonuclease VII
MRRVLTEEQIQKRREYMQRWQKKNREKVRERNRQWYADNQEQEVEKRRERSRNRDNEERNAYMREWRAKNLERVRAVAWARDLKKKYGLTPDQYQKLLDETNGKCPVCKRPFNAKGPVVDHCHSTGIVRGLICSNCNIAEGLLGTPENAQRLADYMSRNGIFYANGG